jgi:hypothetical protein
LVPEESHGARFAWWAAFLATVALIALLNFVRSAEAATVAPPPAPAPTLVAFEAEEETEEEDEEGPTEECEEVAEGELECFTVEPGEEAAPAECKLSQTDASVSIAPNGKIKLTVQFVAATPAMVAVNSHLSGPRGALNLDGERKRFAGSGSFHETQQLGHSQTAKALAARSVMVAIRPLGAPRYCHTYFDQRLSTRHMAAHGLLQLS